MGFISGGSAPVLTTPDIGTATGTSLVLTGTATAGNMLRAQGDTAPSAGTSTEVWYNSAATATGGMRVYDRTGAAYKQLRLDGSVLLLAGSGTDSWSVTGDTFIPLGSNAVMGNASSPLAGVTVKTNANWAGSNGQSLKIERLTELTTVASGVSTQATTIQIPADSIVLAVPVRVTVQPGNTATMTVTATTSTTEFQKGASISTAATTTDPGTKNVPVSYNGVAAQTVTYTFNATTNNALGRIRIDIYYIQLTPPTS